MNTGPGLTIVVLDKDLEALDNLYAFLKPKGFNVLCYSTEAAALEGLHNPNMSWCILITDYDIPDLHPTEFVRQIHSVFPQLPIIPLTPINNAVFELENKERASSASHSKALCFTYIRGAIGNALNLRDKMKKDLLEPDRTYDHNEAGHCLLGHSPKFLAAIDMAKRVSKSSASVLLSGESGTGKEVFAKFIHSHSKQHRGPFVAINCSSIPEHLLESELFGHAKGSFTGAIEKRIGLFEAAENGTLFLDEIGDLGMPLQAKLLRVLQEKVIKRVGENKDIHINCRIVAATHKDLDQEIKDGRFREDLYYRLNVIPISLPALRDRPEDILPLARSFLKKFAALNESRVADFSTDCIEYIVHNNWKGNVRELENMVERAVILCTGTKVIIENCTKLPKPTEAVIPELTTEQGDECSFCIKFSGPLPSLEEVINKYIAFAIVKNGGARDKTAKDIGIDRKTLYRRMQY